MGNPQPLKLPTTATADPVRVSGFPKASPPADIGTCFGGFLRRIVPNHAAYATARESCQDVVAALRTELYPRNALEDAAGTDHLVAGSVGKRTAIAPIQMVDLLYLLPGKLAASKAPDALKIVLAVLRTRFDGAVNAPDQSGILVQRGPLWVKVRPSLRKGGAFLMPGAPSLSRSSGWNVTNPLADAATLRLSDSLYGGRPRLLLAALKAWQAATQATIGSFALELLVQDFYASAPRPYEMDRALVDFWAWARKRTPASLKAPGGQTPLEVGTAWHAKAKAAYWRATLVDHHMKEGKLMEAALEWRHVLGPAFPVPGEKPPRSLPLFRKTG